MHGGLTVRYNGPPPAHGIDRIIYEIMDPLFLLVLLLLSSFIHSCVLNEKDIPISGAYKWSCDVCSKKMDPEIGKFFSS